MLYTIHSYYTWIYVLEPTYAEVPEREKKKL